MMVRRVDIRYLEGVHGVISSNSRASGDFGVCFRRANEDDREARNDNCEVMEEISGNSIVNISEARGRNTCDRLI